MTQTTTVAVVTSTNAQYIMPPHTDQKNHSTGVKTSQITFFFQLNLNNQFQKGLYEMNRFIICYPWGNAIIFIKILLKCFVTNNDLS